MTAGLAKRILGFIVGFVSVLTIRVVILLFLRKIFYSGLYRKNAAVTNIWFLILEVWNVGLAIGFVTARAAKILLIAILYLARVDTPLFAPGVGHIGPVELDSSSTAFRKDLLMHEAHRHPLIERFGLLCLLKLHHGSGFATRAGSAWRLLFVLALMPWLRKYRSNNGVLTDVEEDILALKAELENETDPASRLAIEKDLKMAEERLMKLNDGRSEPISEEKIRRLEMKDLRELNEELSKQIEELQKDKLKLEARLRERTDHSVQSLGQWMSANDDPTPN